MTEIIQDNGYYEIVAVKQTIGGVVVYLEAGSNRDQETFWNATYNISNEMAIKSINSLYGRLNKWTESERLEEAMRIGFRGDSFLLTHDAVNELYNQLEDIYRELSDE